MTNPTALHMIHSRHQIDDTPGLDTHRVIVANAAIDLPYLRSKAPEAKILASFNAAQLYMGGMTSQFWNAFRRPLLADQDHDPFVFPGSLKDPGDDTPHLLIMPSLHNAERYAEAIIRAIHGQGFDAGYVDNGWTVRPGRVKLVQYGYWDRTGAADPEAYGRLAWEAYMNYLAHLLVYGSGPAVGLGRDRVWFNSAGSAPAIAGRVATEVRDDHERLKSAIYLANAGGEDILWDAGFSVEGLFLDGQRTPE